MISNVGPMGMGMGSRMSSGGGSEDDMRLHSDKEVVDRMLSLLRPFKVRLFWSFVLIVIASSSTLAQPWIIQQSIDRGILGGRLDLL
ncbi:MAG: hypothetical protein ACRDI2_17025, partial [Chloroflexota bacterium]